jgi:L-threonylcarbamoyladenylate synthase
MHDVQKAIEIIKNGGVIIFPTDTAFGIGCRIDDEDAVKRLFSIRRRDETKATPVLVGSLKMAEKYLQPISQEVIDTLITPNWPGGLTVILKCLIEKVPELVRNGDTLGVRVPDHLTTIEIINGVGVPIIGSSANFPGDKTPYFFEDLNPELLKLVDYVVPGTCNVKMASTVVDATQKPWKVLREGPVDIGV